VGPVWFLWVGFSHRKGIELDSSAFWIVRVKGAKEYPTLCQDAWIPQNGAQLFKRETSGVVKVSENKW
jgi:hypothetical protein